MALLINISIGAPPANPNDDNTPTIVVSGQDDIDALRATVDEWIGAQDNPDLASLTDPRKLKAWLIATAQDAIYRTRRRAAAAAAAGANIE